MRKTMRVAAALAILTSVWGCASKDDPNKSSGSPEATANTASAAPTASAASTTVVPATATASAATADSAIPAATTSATAGTMTGTIPSATAPATSASATGPKTFDCGAKGQKACPMQGWMKSVMGSAASSGDGEKLASALSYVAGKSPPGMGNWSSIASAGATKAKAGDIDGAKASCKQCHDAYKEKYKTTMRDRPW